LTWTPSCPRRRWRRFFHIAKACTRGDSLSNQSPERTNELPDLKSNEASGVCLVLCQLPIPHCLSHWQSCRKMTPPRNMSNRKRTSCLQLRTLPYRSVYLCRDQKAMIRELSRNNHSINHSLRFHRRGPETITPFGDQRYNNVNEETHACCHTAHNSAPCFLRWRIVSPATARPRSLSKAKTHTGAVRDLMRCFLCINTESGWVSMPTQ
jgi:hypothetical protein